MPLNIKPCHLRAARDYVGRYHRHSVPPVGGKFSVACYDGDRLCGVAICGRPVARYLDDGLTLEILRCCTDGTGNACSKLYGACCRIGFFMGYDRKLEEIESNVAHDRLELSGSRAVWPEVLAVYAVKTTTDPDNPQEVATMDDGKKELLKEIFWAMNEISHRTETATTTQTVETDDGKGNIMVEEVEVTATTLYITVTHKTADEMADIYNFTADQREMLAELLAEESNGMWSAVLYGIGTGDGEIVTVALSQLGNVGGQPYWSWYGFESRVDWCACFVSWCANECGYLDAGVIPRFASCSIGIQWFRERGLWQDRDYEPRPGDLIFFDWDDEDEGQDGAADHVGIVEKVDGGIVYTVEGNSGNACRERQYAIGHAEIYGYGTPAY